MITNRLIAEQVSDLMIEFQGLLNDSSIAGSRSGIQ
jgi:hypothetical protein